MALLGVLGAMAGLALAVGGPPAPRITAHPAVRTRARTAAFAFADSQKGVTFLCSLDGSGYTVCGSRARSGVLAPGRHVFHVAAVSSSGSIGAPASYAWTVDLNAPRLSVSFAARDGYYDADEWKAGCGRLGTGLCGTVIAPSGAKSVIIWIKQDATGRWFNGHAFAARTAVWNKATLVPGRGGHKRLIRASWIYKLALPRPDGSYTLLARASDLIGNLNRLRTQKRVSFEVNNDAPPAPRVTSTPTNPSTSTGAEFTFTDAWSEATFECDLDGAGWRPCGSPAAYSALGPGTHVFEVRAGRRTGGASRPAAVFRTPRAISFSSPTVYQWTISAPGGMPFTITGDVDGALYPGAAAQPIDLTLNNPNGMPIYVTSVSVALDTSSLPAGCSASGYQVAQASVPVSGVAVPAHGSVSLPAQGATAPSIQMIDTGTDQDACQSAHLQLSYAGSAHS